MTLVGIQIEKSFLQIQTSLTMQRSSSSASIESTPDSGMYSEAANLIEGSRSIMIGEKKVGLIPLLDHTGKQAKGTFSRVWQISETDDEGNLTPSLTADFANEDLVVKILRGHHRENAKRYIERSFTQYNFLQKLFAERGVEDPPIVTLCNKKEEAVICGYTLAEKVTPLTQMPWDSTTRITSFNEEQKDVIDRLKMLLEANMILKKASEEEVATLERNGVSVYKLEARRVLSELDLKVDNLGINKRGRIVLLDYVNTRFTLGSLVDSYPRRLSGNNPYVEMELKAYQTGLKGDSPLVPALVTPDAASLEQFSTKSLSTK